MPWCNNTQHQWAYFVMWSFAHWFLVSKYWFQVKKLSRIRKIPEAFTNTYKIHRDKIDAQPKNSLPQATAICRADRCNSGKWRLGKYQRIRTDTVRVEGGKVWRLRRKRSAEREREEVRQPGNWSEEGFFFFVDVLVSVLKWVIERD